METTFESVTSYIESRVRRLDMSEKEEFYKQLAEWAIDSWKFEQEQATQEPAP